MAVGDYMVWVRGENRGSFLTGPSARNTQIERPWTDVVESIVAVFTSLFLFLEANNLLDPGSDGDMCAQHYVILPRVQRLLDRFAQCFNMHSLSTEHSRTPQQLWASGCLRNFNSPNAGIRDVFVPSIPQNIDMYGNDPHAPVPDPEDEAGGVEVPAINFEVSEDSQQALNSNFNPLQDDNNYGIEIYLQVR